MTESTVIDSGGHNVGETRAMQATSGIVWTFLFAAAVAILWALIDWMLASPFPQSTFSRNVLSMTSAALLANFIFPRPFGVPRRGGLGLSCTRSGISGGFFGLAMGVFLVGFSIGVPWAMGAVRFESHAPEAGIWALGGLPALPSAVVMLVIAAFGEELLMRGYGFQQLARAITPAGAALAAGVFFGALHVDNPSSSWTSIINTALFGLLFGFTVVRSRSLWPAIGMHLGWNLSLAVLGANISGLRMGLTAWRATPIGPIAWTGGEYGPEASLVATVAVLAAIVVVWKAPVPMDGSPLIWDDARSSKGGTEDSCDGSH